MHNRVGQAACGRCCKNWASWALAILVKALQTNILKAQRQWLCGSHNTVTVPCLVNFYNLYWGFRLDLCTLHYDWAGEIHELTISLLQTHFPSCNSQSCRWTKGMRRRRLPSRWSSYHFSFFGGQVFKLNDSGNLVQWWPDLQLSPLLWWCDDLARRSLLNHLSRHSGIQLHIWGGQCHLTLQLHLNFWLCISKMIWP